MPTSICSYYVVQPLFVSSAFVYPLFVIPEGNPRLARSTPNAGTPCPDSGTWVYEAPHCPHRPYREPSRSRSLSPLPYRPSPAQSELSAWRSRVSWPSSDRCAHPAPRATPPLRASPSPPAHTPDACPTRSAPAPPAPEPATSETRPHSARSA